jgi:hypothetical protein
MNTFKIFHVVMVPLTSLAPLYCKEKEIHNKLYYQITLFFPLPFYVGTIFMNIPPEKSVTVVSYNI